MDDVDVVRALWERFGRRDFDGAGTLLHADVVVDWPQSGERIRGRANVVELNRNYPEPWAIEVRRVERRGGEVVSWVRVPQGPGAAEWAVSFFRVRGGLIEAATEFWAAEYPPPAWRARWVEPLAQP